MKIIYSSHLLFRLKLRDIPKQLPKQVFLKAKERYFDNQTQKVIAIMTISYKGKPRDIALSYEQKLDTVILITIHPLKNFQKSHRIKSGRWLKI
jgi:hypothetical protein